jgi:hypothetical protein
VYASVFEIRLMVLFRISYILLLYFQIDTLPSLETVKTIELRALIILRVAIVGVICSLPQLCT